MSNGTCKIICIIRKTLHDEQNAGESVNLHGVQNMIVDNSQLLVLLMSVSVVVVVCKFILLCLILLVK